MTNRFCIDQLHHKQILSIFQASISELRAQMEQHVSEMEQFGRQWKRAEMRFGDIERSAENNRVDIY